MPPRKQIAIEMRAVNDLKPHPDNPRTHSDEQVCDIAASIEAFGWTNPILIDADNFIIGGEGRYLAALQLRYDGVPCIPLSNLTEVQRRALRIADNRIGEKSGWDLEKLQSELERLQDEEFDIGLTGFDDDDLGALAGDEPEVFEVETSEIEDTFWISIRGPLADQAEVLEKLRGFLSDYPAVEIEIGTIDLDA